jgi:hypothetical protein
MEEMVEVFVSGRLCGVRSGVGSISFFVAIDDWKPCGDRAAFLGEKNVEDDANAVNDVRSSPRYPVPVAVAVFVDRFFEIVDGGVKVFAIETAFLIVDGGEEWRVRRL